MKQRTKILFLTTTLNRGGAETQLFRLIRGLSKKKEFEIKLVSLNGGDFEKEFKKLNIKLNILSHKISYIKTFKYLLDTKKAIKEFSPDIVHSFLFHTNILSKFTSFNKKNKYKLITSYRADIRGFKLLHNLEKVNFKNVDLAISNSKTGLLGLKGLIDDKKMKVINNGFELPRANLIKSRKIKNKFKGKKIIVTTGNFRKEKGYEHNIKTISKLAKLREDFMILYLGDGPEKDNMIKLSKELGIDKFIKFFGRVNNPQDYLKIADVFFFPTIIEGQPNAILEAMYYKLPIVCSNIDTIKELNAKVNMFDYTDYKKMAKKLNQILDSSFNKKDINFNYEKVNTEFSVKKMVDSYYKAYKELLE